MVMPNKGEEEAEKQVRGGEREETEGKETQSLGKGDGRV